jgi:CheY-like chemotaxis protein
MQPNFRLHFQAWWIDVATKLRKSIRKEFGDQPPRAIVLDDNANARAVTARSLTRRGFEVITCSSAAEFRRAWIPGTVDVIVADWHLSEVAKDQGNRVLLEVRKRDWDVPFVLISGQLRETGKVQILEQLLDGGGARFVERGDAAIKAVCDCAEDLIERRDLKLLKLILAMRQAALQDLKIRTSSGALPARKVLQDVVSKPSESHDAERPLL